MKNLPLIFFFIALLTFSAKAQTDTSALAGENLDLHGVLSLFKESENTDDFEKALNTESNHINNLDLNGDGQVDYIRVNEYPKDNGRLLVLQVPLNDKEVQDVAVLELQQTGEKEAHLQIIGDEDLYGKDYIVEPSPMQADVPSNADNSKMVPASQTPGTPSVVVNVWGWRPVPLFFAPAYVFRASPYRWAVYPVWWKPWRPNPWHIHRRHVNVYHAPYRRVTMYRHPVLRSHYHPMRSRSNVYISKRRTVVRSAPHHAPRQVKRAPNRGHQAPRGGHVNKPRH